MLLSFDNMVWGDGNSQPQQQQQQEKEWYNELLADAIEQIPFHEKTGYLGAIANCPYDVRISEADPLVFIEYENYNFWAAAKRLVKYWEWRVLLFSEPLAYEPLLTIFGDGTTRTTLSEDSSLTDSFRKEFHNIVENQVLVILPKTDPDGNFVFLNTPERFFGSIDCNTDMFVLTFLRINLYKYTIVINMLSNNRRLGGDDNKNSYGMNASFVYLNVLKVNVATKMSLVKNNTEMITDAIPLRLVRVHFFYIPQASSPAWKRFILNTALEWNLVLGDIFKNIALLVPNVCDKETDVSKYLVSYGITSEMLPTQLGGTWQYVKDQFQNNSQLGYDYQKHELVLEKQLLDVINQMRWRETSSYLSMLSNCPIEIRANEAKASVFITYEDGNLSAAAERLVNYWSWRILCFGESLAYRRLTVPSMINNQNSLDYTSDQVTTDHVTTIQIWNEFCEMVESQALVILPQLDLVGNYVMVYDESRLPVGCNVHEHSSKLSRLLLHSVSSLIQQLGVAQGIHDPINNNSNSTGSVVIIYVTKTFSKASSNLSLNVFELLLQVMPARLHSIHMVFVSDDRTQRNLFQSSLVEFTRESKLLQECNVMIIPHLGINCNEIVTQLTTYGLTSEILPYSIGGFWHYPSVVLVERNSQNQNRSDRNEWHASEQQQLQRVGQTKWSCDDRLGDKLMHQSVTFQSTNLNTNRISVSSTANIVDVSNNRLTTKQVPSTGSLIPPLPPNQTNPTLSYVDARHVGNQSAVEYWRQKIPENYVSAKSIRNNTRRNTTSEDNKNKLKRKNKRKVHE